MPFLLHARPINRWLTFDLVFAYKYLCKPLDKIYIFEHVLAKSILYSYF